MATAIYIYSKQRLGEPRGDLEDDLDAFLGGAGEVTGGGGGEAGWNVEVLLDDATYAEPWVDRLAEFLRDRGVPEDTHFDVVSEDQQPRRIGVFAGRG